MSDPSPQPPRNRPVTPGYNGQSGLPIFIQKRKPSHIFTIWPGIAGTLFFVLLAITNYAFTFSFNEHGHLPTDIAANYILTALLGIPGIILAIIICVQASRTTDLNSKLAVGNLLIAILLPNSCILASLVIHAFHGSI